MRITRVMLFILLFVSIFTSIPDVQCEVNKKLMKIREKNIKNSITSKSIVPLATINVPNTNDNCASAFDVTVGNDYVGNNSFSSTDGSSSEGGVNDVWFRFTPTTTSYYEFEEKHF